MRIVYVLALKEGYSPLRTGSGRVITLMQYWKVLLTMTQTISNTESDYLHFYSVFHPKLLLRSLTCSFDNKATNKCTEKYQYTHCTHRETRQCSKENTYE